MNRQQTILIKIDSLESHLKYIAETDEQKARLEQQIENYRGLLEK